MHTFKRRLWTAFLIVPVIAAAAWSMDLHTWSDSEKSVLRSLWLGTLPEIPKDPSNAYADHPGAVAFGKKLFFDSRLSGNMKVSCATCHPPNMNFADNLPLAHGMGTTSRRTMPLIGSAYYTWLFWDGRKDSLWSQALGPIENPVEHGFTRTQCASVIIEHYKDEYESIFGPLPEFLVRDLPPLATPSPVDPSALKAWVTMPRDKKEAVNRLYANMGKAIAAFVRTIVPEPSRFDRYVEAVNRGDRNAMKSILTNDEVKGLRLFMGKAKCTNCHFGPLFTNGDFHNIGVTQPERLPADRGRADAILQVLADEFNCLSAYSDAGPGECAELRFIDTSSYKYIGAFKTPTLRNVAERPPYMHAGQFATLRDVLEFYRDLKPEERSPDLEHGDLNDLELKQIEAFLQTLTSPLQFAQ
jgi:cytochrome c peroxidase